MKRKGKKRSGGGDIALRTEFDQASTMDYLHGDVVDGEHEAACDYEYSRESRVLREAARLHRQGLSPEEIGEDIDQAFHCGGFSFKAHGLSFSPAHIFRKLHGIVCRRRPAREFSVPFLCLLARDNYGALTWLPWSVCKPQGV
jgi:hypothetical protein